MVRQDWFRNTNWDAAVAEQFYRRLQRSRSSFHKGQYLKLQGHTLLESGDFAVRHEGRTLLLRFLQDYPDPCMVPEAHEMLGASYSRERQFEDADWHFRKCLAVMDNNRNFTTGACEVYLAEVTLCARWTDRYAEVFGLLRWLADSRHNPFFNNLCFRLYVARARLASTLNFHEEAAQFSELALQLSRVSKPQFPRHASVGLVDADHDVIGEMRMLSGRKDRE